MSADLAGIDIARTFLALQHGIRLLAANPLDQFHCTSEVQRDYLRNQGHAEVYLHSGNKFGKSTIGIAFDIAMCQGRDELDGIALPKVPQPARWGLFVPDYPSHVTSTQPIIEALIGDWPHVYERHAGVITGARIKPIGWASDDPHRWSLLKVFSCENRRAGVGSRLYGAHFDEPPPMEILREVRKAGEASTVFPLGITATPLKRSQWEPLRDDYPDPVANEGRIVNGYLRLRGESFDNTALTERDKRELLRIYANDPLKEARLHGTEIDTEGMSPFRERYAELMRWYRAATPGDIREWRITREVTTAEGKKLVTETVEVEVWEDHIVGHRYRAIADPSLGIDDGQHDPGACSVWDMTARPARLVAAYRGFIGEYGLAVLTAGLARQYGECVVDPEVGGGYGSAFLSGLRAAGYTRVVNHARSGMTGSQIGFTIGPDTRNEFSGALLEALLASEEGAPWLHIPCKWMLSDLVDLVVDEKMRIVTGAGRHDEGFILAGRAASLLTPDRRVSRVALPQKHESPREAGIKKLREEMGLPVRGKVTSRPRPRFRAPSR